MEIFSKLVTDGDFTVSYNSPGHTGSIVKGVEIQKTNRPMSPVGSLESAIQSYIKIGLVVLEI